MSKSGLSKLLWLAQLGCAMLLFVPPSGAHVPDTRVVMTPELLWQIGRVSDPQVSPDAKTVLYGVKRYSLPANSGRRDLFVVGVEGGTPRQITSDVSADGARWRPDGNRIGYLAGGQLWEMAPDGTARKQLTNIAAGVTGFAWSPDGRKIAYTSPVPIAKVRPDLFSGLDKTSGRLVDDLMFRHWDSWVDSYSHIYVADYAGGSVSGAVDIMGGEPWESPLAPFGGMEQIAWSPDSASIAYTAKKKQGYQYAISTNSEIWLYNLADKTTRNLTQGIMGYDVNPAFSPDGRKLAWLSMEHDGYEADLNRLFVMDLATGARTYLTRGLDRDVVTHAWSADGQTLYFTFSDRGTTHIHRIDTAGGTISRITDGPYGYTGLTVAGKRIVATRGSLSAPEEIFSVDPATGGVVQLGHANDALLAGIKMGDVQERWVTTTDGKQMLVWVVLPPNFSNDRAWPAMLYGIGGPESALDQSWSYRWNLQTLAARGYVVIAPNRRGVPGFGQLWKEQVLGDWGGLPMQDLLFAVDDVAKESWVDRKRLAAVGPSFGGFSTYWLAGNHKGRFKAFVAHDGLFNLQTFWGETEEMWFANSEFLDPYWKAGEDPDVAHAYSGSPHLFVKNWDSPILIIQNELDYRVPMSNGIAAFTAARTLGLPARLLSFPDEGHWVLKPQNSVLWYRTVLDWVDTWLSMPATSSANNGPRTTAR